VIFIIAGYVYQNTFRVNLITYGCFRKLRINTGRPHSGLVDCHGRQVHKTFITHMGFRLILVVQAMYYYGERSQWKLFDVNIFF
jgi:hypothetical protein